MVYNIVKQQIRKMMAKDHKSWKELNANVDYLIFNKGTLYLEIDIADSEVSMYKSDKLLKGHQYASAFDTTDEHKKAKILISGIKTIISYYKR
jgi:hypothetical protein